MDEEEYAQSPMALFMDVLPQPSAKSSTVKPSRKRQPPRKYSPGGSQESNMLIEQASTSAVTVEDSSAALKKSEENDDGNGIAAKRTRKAIASRFSLTPSSLPSTPKSVELKRTEKVILSDYISAVVKAQKGTVHFVFPYSDHGLVDKHSLLSQNDSTAEQDFFYRDVLADVVSTSPSRYCENDIDIETVDPMTTEGLANNIELQLMRPASPRGTYGMSDLFLRAKEESELHRAILDRAVNIILDYHNADNSSTLDSFKYDITSENSGCSSTVALRNLFSMFYSDRKPAIVWVHRFLVEFLPVDFLASYMNLLKTCRRLKFLVVEKIIMKTVGLDDPWPRITEDILTTTKPSADNRPMPPSSAASISSYVDPSVISLE